MLTTMQFILRIARCNVSVTLFYVGARLALRFPSLVSLQVRALLTSLMQINTPENGIALTIMIPMVDTAIGVSFTYSSSNKQTYRQHFICVYMRRDRKCNVDL